MAVPSYKAVINRYRSTSPEVQDYFPYLETLVQKVSQENRFWEISLAYMFIRVETAQNMLLYCGTVKLHRANAKVARSVVDNQHLKRDTFPVLFENVFGKHLKGSIIGKIEGAEKIRNKVIHGKSVSPAEMRTAIVDILEYAECLNRFVCEIAGFKPFDDLRGFKGRGQPLDAKTTRWLMKGLGFQVQ